MSAGLWRWAAYLVVFGMQLVAVGMCVYLGLKKVRRVKAPQQTIKTTKEAGYPAVTISHWAGLFAPKGTPQPILERMNAELLAVVKSKDFQEKLVPQGIEPAPYSLSGYVAFINAERERLGRIARAAKMQAD